MLSDAEKVCSAQSRSLSGAEIRNFFLVGIYPSESKAEVRNYIEKEAEGRQVEWEIMETRFIADTPYSFTPL